MAAFNKFRSFAAAMPNGVHNLATGTLKIALCPPASTPVNTNTQLSNLTVIAYTNLSALTVTTTSSTQTAGLYKLICANLVLTASGTVADFRFVVLYNDTATNKELIGWWDYGSTVTMLNTETFTIDFDAANGVFSLT